MIEGYVPRAATLFADTTARTGQWYKILVVSAAVFTLLTVDNWDGTAIGTTSFPAGSVLYGNFTAITLASGIVLAYKQ